MRRGAPFQAAARAECWRLLALALDRPAEDALGEIAACAEALADARASLAPPLRALAAACADAEAGALEREYHLLFTTRMLASPNESTYHRTARGAVLGDIAAFYEAFGLRLLPSQGAADALRNELLFLSWMSLKEWRAEQRGLAEPLAITRDATRRFIEDHPARWIAAFVDRLLSATTTRFYIQTAGLLMAVMNEVTSEFGISGVEPLGPAGQPAEPDTIPCPASGACAGDSHPVG